MVGTGVVSVGQAETLENGIAKASERIVGGFSVESRRSLQALVAGADEIEQFECPAAIE